MTTHTLNNREFAQRDQEFIAACGAAKITPSTRQASKWRNKTGKAWRLYSESHRSNGTGLDMTTENRNS